MKSLASFFKNLFGNKPKPEVVDLTPSAVRKKVRNLALGDEVSVTFHNIDKYCHTHPKRFDLSARELVAGVVRGTITAIDDQAVMIEVSRIKSEEKGNRISSVILFEDEIRTIEMSGEQK